MANFVSCESQLKKGEKNLKLKVFNWQIFLYFYNKNQ